MAFEPFHSQPTDRRLVTIPPGLSGDERARFVTRVEAAVRQQAAFAQSCDGVLVLSGEVRERGDTLVIPHEPACPLEPEVIENRENRPDLQTLLWFTRTPLAALRVAAADNAAHGGIQPGCLLVDRYGRVKLTDFGITPAYEASCGLAARRHVHLDAARRAGDEGSVSGTWELLPEEAARERGWVAPFFAHELLEGSVRLNPRSDQFALGAVLFLLACGTHPYGAALSDPSLMLYFLLEPYEWPDERRDWAPVFERRAKALTQPADRPVLAWTELVRKLLASDAGDRYRTPADAEKDLPAPSAWAEASAAMSAADACLASGDVDGFLDRLSPWVENGALPQVCRDRLRPTYEEVSAKKQLILRRAALSKALVAAAAALDRFELDAARSIAADVLAAGEAEEPQRRRAAELAALADEMESVGRERFDEWAQVYIEQAHEAVERGDLAAARELLHALLSDPSVTSGLVARGRELLAQAELVEQRLERQNAELSTARDEMQAGAYAAALERIEALLATADLGPGVAEAARAALEDLQRREQRRVEQTAILQQALEAWERCDADALAAALAGVPPAPDDPQVAEARRDVDARLQRLRSALAHRDAALRSLDEQEAEAALRAARAAAALESLPQTLRAELKGILGRCERMRGHFGELTRAQQECQENLFAQARERVDRLLAEAGLPEPIAAQGRLLRGEIDEAERRFAQCVACLERAQEAWEAADLPTLRETLEHLPRDLADRALRDLLDDLTQRAVSLERAREASAAAESDLAAGKRAEALRTAQAALELASLPEVLRAALGALVQRCREAIEAARQETLKRARDALARAQAALDEGRHDACRAALSALPAAEELAEAERAAAAEIERRCAAAEHAARLTERLAAGRKLLDAGRLDQADAVAAEVEADPRANDAVRRSAADLRTRAAMLRPVVRSLKTAHDSLEGGGAADAAAAQAALESLPHELPDWAAKQADALRARLADQQERQRVQSLAQAAAARAELDKALQQLEADLAANGRRAPRFAARVEAVRRAAAASEEQKTRADELLARYEALPKPPPSRMPIFVASGIGAAALVGLVVLLWPRPEPIPPREAAAAAEARLNEVLAARAREACPGAAVWSTRVELNEDETAARVSLVSSAGARREIGDGVAIDALLALAIEGALLDEILPRGPSDEQRRLVAAATERMKTELESARSASFEQLPRWSLAVEFDPGCTVTISATSEGAAPRVLCERIAPERIAECDLDREWLDRVYPPRAPVERAQERLQRRVAAAASESGRNVGATIRIDVRDAHSAEVICELPGGARVPVAAPLALADLGGFEIAQSFIDEHFKAKTPPPPPPPPRLSAAELARQFEKALRTSLGADGEGLVFRADGDLFRAELAWAGRAEPLTVAGIRIDASASGVDPADVARAANPLKAQIAMLKRIEQRSLRVDLPEPLGAYERAIEPAAGALAAAVFGDFDSGTASVGVKVPARLRGDDREGAGFAVSGAAGIEGSVRVDGRGVEAFEHYLRGLQEFRCAEVAAAARGALAVPSELRLEAAASPAADACEMVVSRGDGAPVVKLTAAWDPEKLGYAFDRVTAAGAVRAALREAIASDDALADLGASWPAARGAIVEKLGVGAVGRAYLEACALIRVAPRDVEPKNAWSVPATARVAPESVGDAGAVEFDVELRFGGDGFDWSAPESAVPAIRLRLDALDDSDSFRTLRSMEELAVVARERGIPPDELKRTIELPGGGRRVLRAEKSDAQGKLTFTWEWDRSALRWGNRNEVRTDAPPAPPPAPRSIEERLAALASAKSIAPAEFVAVLADVVHRKTDTYGRNDYTLDGALLDAGVDPSDRLSRLTASLRRDAAPDPAAGACPVVFIEYHVGKHEVFGLGWQSRSNAASESPRVEMLRVWRVGSSSALPEKTDDLHALTTKDGAELAKNLLAPAFDGAVRAAEDGRFGVLIAPFGPLWMVRWEQVRLPDLPGQGLKPQSVRNLREALRENPGKAGIWCVPTLAGRWTRKPEGAVGDKMLLLGDVAPWNFEHARFAQGERGFFYLRVNNPASRDTGQWGTFFRKLNAGNIGATFWEFGWNGDQYEASQIRSFALIQPPR